MNYARILSDLLRGASRHLCQPSAQVIAYTARTRVGNLPIFAYKSELGCRTYFLRANATKSTKSSEAEQAMTSSPSTINAPKGLEGVVATTSGICYIDGEQGVLAYRGIDIHELADNSNFEETCYLLWNGKLPTRDQLKELHERLAEERKLDPGIINLLRTAPRQALPMDVLRTAVSALALYDAEEKINDHEANVHKAIRVTSQIAMIVCAYDRIRKGKSVVEPDRSLSHSANFLLMLNGEKPSLTAERALDIALILHADHELNASTFAARVTAATLSDMHSAVTSAIGALKGPLHGGANEAVFQILQAVDNSGADPVDYIKGMLAQKKKIPGFGHRVYHSEDPRATHLRKMSHDLGQSSGQGKWFDMSQKIEQFVKADKKLNANVDFYSASTYHILGIEVDLFTLVFAVSRVSGWTAHVIEQLDDNRLIRPRAEYIGPAYPQHWVSIEQRDRRSS
jgi:citrate synthase